MCNRVRTYNNQRTPHHLFLPHLLLPHLLRPHLLRFPSSHAASSADLSTFTQKLRSCCDNQVPPNLKASAPPPPFTYRFLNSHHAHLRNTSKKSRTTDSNYHLQPNLRPRLTIVHIDDCDLDHASVRPIRSRDLRFENYLRLDTIPPDLTSFRQIDLCKPVFAADDTQPRKHPQPKRKGIMEGYRPLSLTERRASMVCNNAQEDGDLSPTSRATLTLNTNTNNVRLSSRVEKIVQSRPRGPPTPNMTTPSADPDSPTHSSHDPPPPPTPAASPGPDHPQPDWSGAGDQEDLFLSKVRHYFKNRSPPEQTRFLADLLNLCTSQQLSFVRQYVDPLLKKDPFTSLPNEICLRVCIFQSRGPPTLICQPIDPILYRRPQSSCKGISGITTMERTVGRRCYMDEIMCEARLWQADVRSLHQHPSFLLTSPSSKSRPWIL